jgi:hypothetical protein
VTIRKDRALPKFRSASIKELLRVGEVDDEELATVLTSVLPRGAQLSANEVEYRTSEDEWVLSLRYSEGLVVDAATGPAFTPAIGEQIRQALADALDGTTKKVWRVPMFSLRRIEGWYRHKDDFLIRPAPEEAPRPNEEYAQHPWVLEFSFVDSPNFQVCNLRKERRSYELALILNLLLSGQIDRPTNRGRKHWVFTRMTDGTPGIGGSEWLQEGYFIPDFILQADDFSNVDAWSPLAEVPTDAYYGRRGFDGKPLAVPTSMTDLGDAFGRLSDSRRNRFLRSCYWLHMADVVWTYSQSLNLVSLINGLECLAQGGEKRLETDASTKMFLDFMQEYAPGRPSRTRLNKIYEVRSLVTHGERLLGYDTPQAFGLHPTSTADRESGTEAILLARGAIINWLVREAGGPANLLTNDPYPKQPVSKPGTKSKMKIITA